MIDFTVKTLISEWGRLEPPSKGFPFTHPKRGSVRLCVSVCGPAPLLGCRPIRVRVESIYCTRSLCNTINPFTLLHGITGLGFPPNTHSQPPASSTSGRRLPTSVPLPPGGSTFPPGGGTPSHLLVPLLGRQPPPLLCSLTPQTEGVLAHGRRSLIATGARRRRRRLAAQGAGAAAIGAGAGSARRHIGSLPPRRASAPPHAATSLPSGPRASSPTRRSSRLRRPSPPFPQRRRPPVPPDRRAGSSHRRRAAATPLPRPWRGLSSPTLRKLAPPSMARRPALPCSAGADPALAAPGGALAAPFPSRPSPLSSGRSHLGLAVPPQLAPCPVAHASHCSALPPAHFASSLSSSTVWLPHPCNLPLRPRGSTCSSRCMTQGSSSHHDLAGAPFPNSRRPFLLSATSLPRTGLLLLARVVQPPQCFHRRA
jgi:hypothetical protein